MRNTKHYHDNNCAITNTITHFEN